LSYSESGVFAQHFYFYERLLFYEDAISFLHLSVLQSKLIHWLKWYKQKQCERTRDIFRFLQVTVLFSLRVQPILISKAV